LLLKKYVEFHCSAVAAIASGELARIYPTLAVLLLFLLLVSRLFPQFLLSTTVYLLLCFWVVAVKQLWWK